MDMRQFDTETGKVPVTLEARIKPGLTRIAPPAAFLSQLIAERYHMATQRQRRRASVDVAVATYRTGGDVAVRRLPVGYRTKLDV